MATRIPRRLSRRGFLVGSSGTAAVLGLSPQQWAWAADRARRTTVNPVGTTLAATIVPAGAGPYLTTAEGPGEPTLVRTELQAPSANREDRRTILASLVQFTDQHLIDAQSPGRVEFLDPAGSPFTSAFRPQELLTAQVATSMVERVNQLGAGPVGGRAFDCVVCTGDNIDNQQLNELQWLLAILDGGVVTPNSGGAAYEGLQDAVDTEVARWHPEPGVSDDFKSVLGYPDVPGLLSRAVSPFSSPGLNAPWYSVFGNHDCNVQGNAARSDAMDQVFVGAKKMTAIPAGESEVSFILRVMFDAPSVLADLASGTIPSRPVTADPARRTATVSDWISAHLGSATGSHGYGTTDLAEDRLYYEFPVAPGVVGISLDTTNHAGGPNGAGGSIGSGQLLWLMDRLSEYSERHLDEDGTEVRTGGSDQLVLIFSHHASWSMNTDEPDPAHPLQRRVLGDELVSVLQRFPNVVAWINGHNHTNRIEPRPHPLGLASGFWEISTASHVDWPQQARVLELADNADGSLSLFTTMIEHLGPASVDRDASSAVGLAGLSRELGLNDPQSNASGRRGDALARNVELVLPVPFLDPVAAPPTSAPADPAQPLPATPTYTG